MKGCWLLFWRQQNQPPPRKLSWGSGSMDDLLPAYVIIPISTFIRWVFPWQGFIAAWCNVVRGPHREEIRQMMASQAGGPSWGSLKGVPGALRIQTGECFEGMWKRKTSPWCSCIVWESLEGGPGSAMEFYHWDWNKAFVYSRCDYCILLCTFIWAYVRAGEVVVVTWK